MTTEYPVYEPTPYEQLLDNQLGSVFCGVGQILTAFDTIEQIANNQRNFDFFTLPLRRDLVLERLRVDAVKPLAAAKLKGEEGNFTQSFAALSKLLQDGVRIFQAPLPYAEKRGEISTFGQYLTHVLNECGLQEKYKQLSRKLTDSLIDGGTGHTFTQNEIFLLHLVIRNIADYSLLSVASIKGEETTPDDLIVSAIAVDELGNPLAFATKTKDRPGLHAEEILLESLGGKRPFMVGTSMEPCNMRNPEKYPNRRSCSEILIENRVPVVAFVLPDQNSDNKNLGSGGIRLREGGVLLFENNIPELAMLCLGNLHEHKYRDQYVFQRKKLEEKEKPDGQIL